MTPPLRLRIDVALDYQVRSGEADAVLNIQAARTPHQQVLQETLTATPLLALREDLDPATGTRRLRLRAAPGPLGLHYSATLELTHHLADPQQVHEMAVGALPAQVLPFLYPSRYCESDKLNAFAMGRFGALPLGHARVQAICDWVRRHVQFTSGASAGTTSAADTFVQRRGVCRDFAHLMIALCRALNIPARFATGMDYGADPSLGPPDFHAYVEAWLGGRWYLFDPSGTATPLGLMRFASGRDAADCAWATIFGDVLPLNQRLQVIAVAGADGQLRLPGPTALAISTAAD